MAGFSTDKADINSRVGGIAVTLRDTLEDAERVAGWLNDQTEQSIIDKGFTQAEVTTMKAAFNAFVVLKSVANGQATVPVADNFFFHAKKLTGMH